MDTGEPLVKAVPEPTVTVPRRHNPGWKNLLSTGRSCKIRGLWVQVPLASERKWLNLEFSTRDEAQRCGKTLLVTLREKRALGMVHDDATYNGAIHTWLLQVVERTKQYQARKEAESGKAGVEESQAATGEGEVE